MLIIVRTAGFGVKSLGCAIYFYVTLLCCNPLGLTCIIYVPRGGDSLTELLPAQKGAPRSSPPAVGVAPLGNASVPGVSVLDSF